MSTSNSSSSKFFMQDWTITLPSHPNLQFIRLIPRRYDSLIEIFSNPLNDPQHAGSWTEEDTKATIERFSNCYTNAKTRHNALEVLVTEHGTLIGLGLIQEIETRVANIGIMLTEAGRGHGVGTALMTVLLSLSNELDVDMVEAGSMKDNAGMRRLMKSLGIKEVEEDKILPADGRLVAEVMFKDIDRQKWKELDFGVKFGDACD